MILIIKLLLIFKETKMKNLFISLLGMLLSVSLYAQNVTQTVKGQIIDKQSEIPIIGATIQWINDQDAIGTTTDIDGYFKLDMFFY